MFCLNDMKVTYYMRTEGVWWVGQGLHQNCAWFDSPFVLKSVYDRTTEPKGEIIFE